MKIKHDVVRGIKASGIRPLTTGQKRIIAPIMAGRDCTVETQTGVNENTAMLIALLHNVDASFQTTQVLILTPSRELAQQTSKIMIGLGRHLGIYCNFCIDANPLMDDAHRMAKRPHVVVGTHARVLQMIHRGALDIGDVAAFCLVDADTMLSRGRAAVAELLLTLRAECQFVVLSPGLSGDVLDATRWYMRDPARVEIQYEAQIRGIKQYYIAGEGDNWKLDTLIDLWEREIITHAIIYCVRRERVDKLIKQLRGRDMRVFGIRSEKEYKREKRKVEEFGYGTRGVIVTSTELDGGSIPLIIDYDMPRTVDEYVRRVDDGGRCGSRRVGISFVSPEDVGLLVETQQTCDVRIEELPGNYRPATASRKANGKVSLVEWRKCQGGQTG